MGTYYYAAAALPMLFLSEKPQIESGDFLEFCREQMSEKDFEILESSHLDVSVERSAEGKMNDILRSWYRWERSLRNELAKSRASGLGKDAAEYLREGEEIIGMEETVKQAASADTPLETERRLYEARWNYLDDLGTNIFFTLESLIVYYLKLQLLEKLNLFEKERGEEKFNEIYSRIRETELIHEEYR